VVVADVAADGAYAATKHGLTGLTKSAALDHAAANIRINALCPGIIDTEMMRRFTGDTHEGRAAVIAQEPDVIPPAAASGRRRLSEGSVVRDSRALGLEPVSNALTRCGA
jgi:NAD(P)-dependent dehydrogenase (short-subunit alcohol dehydrogenase family)